MPLFPVVIRRLRRNNSNSRRELKPGETGVSWFPHFFSSRNNSNSRRELKLPVESIHCVILFASGRNNSNSRRELKRSTTRTRRKVANPENSRNNSNSRRELKPCIRQLWYNTILWVEITLIPVGN
jgi:hypothetical protein